MNKIKLNKTKMNRMWKPRWRVFFVKSSLQIYPTPPNSSYSLRNAPGPLDPSQRTALHTDLSVWMLTCFAGTFPTVIHRAWSLSPP
jgi:hypothetical protein